MVVSSATLVEKKQKPTFSNAEDERIRGYKPVAAPDVLHFELPQSKRSEETVIRGRNEISRVVDGVDLNHRLLVVVGPCSIHDPAAALEYCDLLLKAKERFHEDLVIVMRAYLEKPRTTVGWKGLINDPDLDGTFKINKGLRISRKLLLDLTEKGMPLASEMLDTITPQFLADLLSCGAVGARTTESQLHREMASGLSFPVGFKNGTDGSLDVAVDAMAAVQQPHHFLSITKPGVLASVVTTGNEHAFTILRGGNGGTNYHKQAIQDAKAKLAKAGARSRVMIDCSHGNSQKDYRNQPKVAAVVSQQVKEGDDGILGVMIESHLKEGKQKCGSGHPLNLEYGVSITDGCVGWEETEDILEELADAVKQRRRILGNISSS